MQGGLDWTLASITEDEESTPANKQPHLTQVSASLRPICKGPGVLFTAHPLEPRTEKTVFKGPAVLIICKRVEVAVTLPLSSASTVTTG